MNYTKLCELKANDPNINIFPKGTTDKEAINILCEYFVPKNEILAYYPASRDQIVTEFLAYIMLHYPSVQYQSYPWYKKLWINIKCIFSKDNIFNYY